LRAIERYLATKERSCILSELPKVDDTVGGSHLFGVMLAIDDDRDLFDKVAERDLESSRALKVLQIVLLGEGVRLDHRDLTILLAIDLVTEQYDGEDRERLVALVCEEYLLQEELDLEEGRAVVDREHEHEGRALAEP